MTNFKTLPNTSNLPKWKINKNSEVIFVRHIRHAVAIDEKRVCFKANRFRPDDAKQQHESFEEIWFAGSHCDVGGGYEEPKSGLSKIALEWMYQEAQTLGCQLEKSQIEFFLVQSEAGKEFDQTPPNVKQEVNSSFSSLWYFLEFIPRRQWSHVSGREGMKWHFPNLFRPRKIPDDAKFHPSVKEKLTEDPKYSPKNLPAGFDK